MNFAKTLFQPPASDYPADDKSLAPNSRAVVLVALFLACFLLRWLMSLTWDVLWADGVIYLKNCQLLEQGNFDEALKGLGINTYPVILMAFRRLGLEWSTAAVWWSVLMASLTVLPLYGWIRRQFDDRVATVACILYAMHPKLLGFSPLTIRDPTFWFLFISTLYLLWRGVGELRYRLLVLGGLVLALACLTRIEGWLLMTPLTLWPLGRFFSLQRKEKVRMAAGTLAAMSMLPLLLVVINLTVLRDHSRWEFGHNYCISHAVKLFGKLSPADDEAAAKIEKTAAKPAAKPDAKPDDPGAAVKPDVVKTGTGETTAAKPEEPKRKSTAQKAVKLIGKVGSRLVKAFTYAYGLLVLVGLWAGRRSFVRREHQTIFLMNTLLLVAIGMRQSLDGIDVRYYLPIVIVGFSFMALGFLQVVQWLCGLFFAKDADSPSRRTAVAVALLLIIAAVGLPNIFPVARSTMYEHSHLGMWIHDNLGPGRKIVGSRRKQSLVEYYAEAEMLSNSSLREYTSEPLEPLLEKGIPDVVLLWREWRHSHRWSTYTKGILDCQEELGYIEIPRQRLPERCVNVRVLVREEIFPKEERSPLSRSAPR